MNNKKNLFIKKIIIIALVSIFCLHAPGSFGDGTVLEKRKILALYDSTDPFLNKRDYNLIHLNAEMPLNYLGLIVEYYDIAQGMPEDEKMEKYRGIITWFEDDELPDAKGYCKWITKQVKSGKKLIIMNSLGAYIDKRTGEKVDEKLAEKPFNAIGLSYQGGWTNNPLLIKVVYEDKSMVEFERSLENEVSIYELVRTLTDKAEVYLKIKRNDIADSESDAVVVTPNGGYVQSGYGIFTNKIDGTRKWRIDPFRFFAECLDVLNMPALDTTTLNGRRILYSHIDGDGFRNVSSVDGSSFSSEIIYEQILKKYNIPITASFIVCEIDTAYYGTKKLQQIAKDIAALDNVEIGIHGFSHPLDWAKKLTAFSLKGYSKKAVDKKYKNLISESDYGDAAIVTVSDEEYYQKEINYAIDLINKEIMPQGKRAKVYQWTGNCEPTIEAMKRTYEEGILNINGGDTRMDRFSSSYTSVAPLSRDMGEYRQIYTSNSNENIYTEGWKAPYDRYKYVIETFKETEYPDLFNAPCRRVTPINIYYHYYSGEKKEALQAVELAYDYAINDETAPIFTSQYLEIVSGFFEGEIYKTGINEWEIKNYNACRTIRIRKNAIYPDLDESINILGYKEWEDYIYIHLGEGSIAKLVFSKERPKRAFLVEASAVVNNAEIDKNKTFFKTRIFGEGIFKFANMEKLRTYEIDAVDEDGTNVFTRMVRASISGGLTAKIPISGIVDVTIKKT